MRAGAGSFPQGFLWGAATSAFQIEGATNQDGRGPSIWDTFTRIPGAIRNGETAEIADDHYHRYREDVALMAELGIRAYRFSIAWPRIQPSGHGPPLQAGLDFYRRLTDALLEASIEPMITLFHWDLPQELQDRGGWPARETAMRFGEYTRIVFEALRDRVRWWGPITEPWCVAFPSYAGGTSAPGERDPVRAISAAHHILLAHGVAVSVMRSIDPTARLGIFLNLHPVRPAVGGPTPLVNDAVRRIDALQNRFFLDPLLRGSYPADAIKDLQPYGTLPVAAGDLELMSAPLDWLGVNYYFDKIIELADQPSEPWLDYPGVAGIREARPTAPTDMGWPITPSGLHDLLLRIASDYPDAPPILVTENGAAYDDPIGPDGTIDDSRRVAYLDAHIGQVLRAIASGADIRGYFVWSLMDNFEWARGYSMRFGLVHVDYETQRRSPRRSAHWYRDVIAQNRLAG
jgi:beta-glucosidase